MKIWHRWTLGIVLSTMAGMAASAQESAAPTIGLVFQKDYEGAVGTLDQTQRELIYSLPVYSNEVVTTDSKGSTALQFLDKTRLQIGANSSIVLDRFVYDPSTGTGDAALRFSQGVFRFVSGGFKNKGGYQLATPSASLSIRGTKVLVYVDKDGNTIFYFEEGWGIVKNQCGKEAEVRAGQSAISTLSCELSVVVGNLVPPDAAVMTDLPVPEDLAALLDLLDSLEPAAGPPEDDTTPPKDDFSRGDPASPS